jgi:hypothetical protein
MAALSPNRSQAQRKISVSDQLSNFAASARTSSGWMMSRVKDIKSIGKLGNASFHHDCASFKDKSSSVCHHGFSAPNALDASASGDPITISDIRLIKRRVPVTGTPVFAAIEAGLVTAFQ